MGNSPDDSRRGVVRWLIDIHAEWAKHPVIAAGVALALSTIAVVSAFALGIALTFPADRPTYPGFLNEEVWGAMYLLGFPVAVMLVAALIKYVGRLIRQLDILKSVPGNRFSFSEALEHRFETTWAGIILPLCALTTFVIVLGIDHKAIFWPLHCGALPRGMWGDWTTEGACTFTSISKQWYLAFNLYAFLLEALLVYCGLVVLIGVSFALVIIAYKGLEEPDETDSRVPDSLDDVDFGKHYYVEWDYKAINGRCGLDPFDKVLSCFAAILVGTLFGAKLLKAYENSANVEGHVAVNVLLVEAVCATLTLVLFLGIFIPLSINFPRSLPKGVEGEKPSFWPVNQWFVGAVTGALVYLWGSLLKSGGS